MPKLIELAAERKDQGLVLIGIHTENNWEEMAAYVDKTGIEFPVCVDAEGTIAAWGADSFPDYAIVDRQGILRVAALANGGVDHAVEVLLAEDDHLSTALSAALPAEGEYQSAVFEFRSEDSVVGKLTIGSSYAEVKDSRVVTFAQTFDLHMPGTPEFSLGKMSFSGALELGPQLTPKHFTVEAEGGRVEADVTRDGTEFVAAWGGDLAESRFPVGALVDWSLFVLAPGLPAEEGFAFEAPLFSMEDRELEEVHRVQNHGLVDLDFEGESRKAWHWVVTNTEAQTTDVKLEMWIADGELLRIDFDGKQLVRVEE